ncbi:MAG TPA: sugar phosphate nucleotidyltransferase [Sedimentisphaerales bacterium]|nr:sugar phosphate nucleotidyltransferase [Sedimentisphaerales bacterium]
MKPTLLILAAGLGARYDGLKQIDPVGPNGEIIIDYSIYDAIRAGFGRLVFVIQHYFEDAFKHKIGDTFHGVVETAYAYQELDAALGDFPLPPDREKPWGTGHAVLVARELIDKPFAVINADDYYGIDSFKMMAQFLSGPALSPTDCAMVGFRLGNTLSDYGSVARGVCHCDDELFLRDIVERTRVEKHGRAARYFDNDGTEHALSGDEVVSMNLWGFHPSIFTHLSRQFRDFLKEHGNEKITEFFVPTAVGDLVESGRVKVKVLPTHDNWFGITYKKDREIAERSIARLIADGVYPKKLWEQ